MKRLISYLLLGFLLILMISAVPASAQSIDSPLFTVALNTESVPRGASFSITLTPARLDISAFLLRIEFDEGICEVSSSSSETLKDAYTYTYTEDGHFSLVFASKKGTALQSDDPITLIFRTDQDTPLDHTRIDLEISDASNSAADPLLSQAESHTFEVDFQPAPSSDCALLSLIPPVGTLTPAFNPTVFEYTLEVPYSYTALEFDATPAENALVRVNRKNLGAGGSTVDYRFTVTAADQTNKSIYTVAVTRLEKENSASDSEKKSSSSSGKKSNTTLETSAPPPDSNTSENKTQEIVYISSGESLNIVEDRILTAAIVLISVGAGMGFVLLAQHFSDKRKK